MIRLGSVPFLNVKPLVFPLEQNIVEHDFQIISAPPAELSRMLEGGDIDLGLVPVAELIKERSYSIVPGISISSFGPVDSVVLLSKVELREIKTVAVDRRSQSSAGLLRVIMDVFIKTRPEYVKADVEAGVPEGVEACMFIGNSGLKYRHFPPEGYGVYDLGEIWTEHTGLPFVYGVYAVGEGVELGSGVDALLEAKSVGVKMAEKIAMIESPKIGLSEEVCLRYITERIRYELGEKELEGMKRFADYLDYPGELGELSGGQYEPKLYGGP